MKALNRLGLGTMGMSIVRNPENSVKTIRAALDAGIESLVPAGRGGMGMRNFVFTDGKMALA